MTDILFLAHRIPFPPDRGDKIRSWHVLKHLAELARVHLACFADDAADAAHLPALRAALGPSLGEAHLEIRRVGKLTAAANALSRGTPVSVEMFRSPTMAASVRAMLAGTRVDAVYAFSGQMAQFVADDVSQRFVMDFVDVDSAKFQAYADAGGPLRQVHAREAKRLAAFETEVAARADLSLFVSEAEAALFRTTTGLPTVRALANGIDAGTFDPDAAITPLPAVARGEGPLLLFTGQMDYRPNIDAVCWFAAEVLPSIRHARFVIAGRSPPPEVLALVNERVIVTGAVADMRSWLVAADVVVAPLRIARGIQNKVLEAMAMARPVVATGAAFEGIEAEPGRDLVVEDAPAAMAAAINELLADPAAARRLGAAARALVLERYRWEARLAPLQSMLFPAGPARVAA